MKQSHLITGRYLRFYFQLLFIFQYLSVMILQSKVFFLHGVRHWVTLWWIVELDITGFNTWAIEDFKKRWSNKKQLVKTFNKGENCIGLLIVLRPLDKFMNRKRLEGSEPNAGKCDQHRWGSSVGMDKLVRRACFCTVWLWPSLIDNLVPQSHEDVWSEQPLKGVIRSFLQ